jgi:hypothetical protein
MIYYDAAVLKEIERRFFAIQENSEKLDFIHLVDKKKRQDKLISTIKEKSYAYLAPLYYDYTTTICASVSSSHLVLGTDIAHRRHPGAG